MTSSVDDAESMNLDDLLAAGKTFFAAEEFDDAVNAMDIYCQRVYVHLTRCLAPSGSQSPAGPLSLEKCHLKLGRVCIGLVRAFSPK
jgi:hypothetical protein